MRPDEDARFEWDEAKRLVNIDKHGIDFRDAITIFDEAVVETPSVRSNEDRWKAVGRCDDILIALVYTRTNGRRRIISARPAKRNERQQYRAHVPERSPPSAG